MEVGFKSLLPLGVDLLPLGLLLFEQLLALLLAFLFGVKGRLLVLQRGLHLFKSVLLNLDVLGLLVVFEEGLDLHLELLLLRLGGGELGLKSLDLVGQLLLSILLGFAAILCFHELTAQFLFLASKLLLKLRLF